MLDRAVFPALCLLALAGGCASIPSVSGPPDRVWPASRTLANATSCVVARLDVYGRSETPPVTHSVRVSEAGKMNEVRPRDDLPLAATSYFVRLESSTDQLTRIALYAPSARKRSLIETLAPCGE